MQVSFVKVVELSFCKSPSVICSLRNHALSFCHLSIGAVPYCSDDGS